MRWARMARGRAEFKRRRRCWEFELITGFLRETLVPTANRMRILEFGCGPAGGARLLAAMGDLVESDVYRDERMSLPPGVSFVVCSIVNAPFPSGHFDLVVSNQVLEHIDRLSEALAEVKRIARKDALFAFSVPTSTWLVLTIPGQVAAKVVNIWKRIVKPPVAEDRGAANHGQRAGAQPAQPHQGIGAKIRLRGHGCFPRFFQCLRAFRLKRWRSLLRDHGFVIAREEPLLCYGSSHFPLIPTNRVLARFGISASHLFIVRRGA